MRHSKSSLFLMELIIALLFFSLASAVCVQLFAKSHMLSKQTVNTNQSITALQTMAESWLAVGGDLEVASRLLESSVLSTDDDKIYRYYDKEWNLLSGTNMDEVSFVAELKNCSESGMEPGNSSSIQYGMRSASLCTYSLENLEDKGTSLHPATPDTVIYAFTVKHNVPERRGALE